MSSIKREDIVAAGRSFYFAVAMCTTVFALVHVVPKNAAPRNTMRLAYTISYFASLIALCWFMTAPRSRYLQLVYRWRYENSPPLIDRAWRRYLMSLDRLVNILAYASLAFLSSTAIFVLSLWFDCLNSIAGLCNAFWWASLAGLLACPLAGNFM